MLTPLEFEADRRAPGGVIGIFGGVGGSQGGRDAWTVGTVAGNDGRTATLANLVHR